jgi:hypothetical protein
MLPGLTLRVAMEMGLRWEWVENWPPSIVLFAMGAQPTGHRFVRQLPGSHLQGELEHLRVIDG